MLNKILGSIFVIIILLFGIDYVYMESTDKKCNIDLHVKKLKIVSVVNKNVVI
jgi:hypothetical protein